MIALAVLVLIFGLISKRLQPSVITPPMFFAAGGLLLGPYVLGWLDLEVNEHAVHLFAELTLVLVLFTDAAGVDWRALRRDLQIPLRMLGLGMPLTIVLGTLAALWLVPELVPFEAALLAAMLAPTDAALGQAVVTHPEVPGRVRASLNVESGVNDGIALPVVLVFAACAEAMGQHELSPWLAYTAKQLALGLAVGVAIGYLGGKAVDRAVRGGWMNVAFEQLAGLALALLAFFGAEQLGGNGFIAAFIAGLTLGNTTRSVCLRLREFAEVEGELLSLITFSLFGALLVVPAAREWNGATFAYAVLSLTLVRLLPVALSLIGVDLRPVSVAFLGWFGPRGLASILFGLLIVNRMELVHRELIFSVVVATVLLSIVAHGASAAPAARAYARYISEHPRGRLLREHTIPPTSAGAETPE